MSYAGELCCEHVSKSHRASLSGGTVSYSLGLKRR